MSKTPRISEAVRYDPILFTESLLKHPDGTPIIPHDGQRDMLNRILGKKDSSIVAGRQFGKSTGLSWFIVWWMLKYPHRHMRIIAPTLDQSRIIFNEVAAHFRLFPLSSMLARKIVDFPFPNIKLTNGTECHARGANTPQYIRGQPTDFVVVDEAAYIKEGVFPAVIQPLLTVTGKKEGNGFIRISTPFGEGDFQDGYRNAEKDESGTKVALHYTSLDNPHADMEELMRVKNTYGENSLIWQVEYLGNFAASDRSVFDWNDIKWATSNFPETDYPIKAKKDDRYVQGVDLANQRDYFVSTMLNATDPLRLVQVRHDRWRQKGYVFYKSIIRENHFAYNRALTQVDATSLGESVVEDLSDIGAEGYKFSGTAAKYDIVHNLVRLMSEHRVVIPPIKELVDELKYFQYEITASNNLKMEAKTGYHDDYVMSLALSGERASRPLFTGFFMGTDLEPGPAPIQPPDYNPFKDDDK